MPYIPRSRRDITDAETAGELNYLITRVILKWLGHDYDYDRLNAAVGVLELVKLETHRRLIIAYEEQKRQENGDVY